MDGIEASGNLSMCSSPPITDMCSPPDRYSVFDEGWEEADRHKWNRSREVGYDLGEPALSEWVRDYWHTFLRYKWLEHIDGRKFWIELDQVDFGILRRRFHDSQLLRPILDQLIAGKENLNIINWALDEGHPMEDVHEILEALHINSTRLEFQVEARLERRQRIFANLNPDSPQGAI